MTTRLDVDYVVRGLVDLMRSRSREERLNKGYKMRQEIAAASQAGLPLPDNYRTKWLADTINRTIDFLQAEAGKFDAQHRDDMISVVDLGDVISGVQRLISKAIKKASHE